MNVLNLETAELVPILIVAVVLFAGLGLFKFLCKITRRVLTLGCLGILVVLLVLFMLAMKP